MVQRLQYICIVQCAMSPTGELPLGRIAHVVKYRRGDIVHGYVVHEEIVRGEIYQWGQLSTAELSWDELSCVRLLRARLSRCGLSRGEMLWVKISLGELSWSEWSGDQSSKHHLRLFGALCIFCCIQMCLLPDDVRYMYVCTYTDSDRRLGKSTRCLVVIHSEVMYVPLMLKWTDPSGTERFFLRCTAQPYDFPSYKRFVLQVSALKFKVLQ